MISSLTKAALALAGATAAAVGTAQQLQVQVDGQAVRFPDTQPQMIGSVAMVPLRTVCEQMGGTVIWDQAAQTITTTLNGSNVILRIGDSEATVDGKMEYLDLPPTIIGDRALVPMRFFGNSFGSQVSWIAGDNLVAINTRPAAPASASTPSSAGLVALTPNEVVPVTLDEPLSSSTSYVGETFTATVFPNGTSGYAGLPGGTKVEGHVAAVTPMTDTEPAILDLAFDRVDVPGQPSETVGGCLISLDTEYAMQGDDGIYIAQNDGKSYLRMAYVGYGSNDGWLVGVNVDEPLAGQPLDDSMSSISAQVPEYERQVHEILLPAGTEFGVRINETTYLSVDD
ncbi:MAG: copper amine oxidase N-terminal domain-containing protein [Fimbriimonadales bacterium]